jgi:hypothetical protein
MMVVVGGMKKKNKGNVIAKSQRHDVYIRLYHQSNFFLSSCLPACLPSSSR